MAGRGFAPNPNSINQRKNHRGEWIELELEAFDPPELPRGYRDGKRSVVFRDETREWFESWRESPQARRITRTGWQRLLMLARLVDQFHRSPSTSLLAEIRLNEQSFGATPRDMLSLRWNLKERDEAAGHRRVRRLTAVPSGPAS
jgi:hypothetical protein